jgi:very-short-patch-repair endonuclease
MDAQPETLSFARRLRKHMTRSEVILWQKLREGRLDGLRFRRQHPFGAYVLDFFCAAARLAVEVDGAVHDGEPQAEADHARDRSLDAKGVQTLRVSSAEVIGDPDGVLERIRWAVRQAMRTA